MVKFSKPKKGDIRYLVFRTMKGEWWIQKVKITKAGKRVKWFSGHIIDYIDGNAIPVASENNNTGGYHYWQFVDSENDARKMLIYSAFDTRHITLFYRQTPDLENLTQP